MVAEIMEDPISQRCDRPSGWQIIEPEEPKTPGDAWVEFTRMKPRSVAAIGRRQAWSSADLTM
jgi:uncharacterized protein YbdZ (MbtH family)